MKNNNMLRVLGVAVVLVVIAGCTYVENRENIDWIRKWSELKVSDDHIESFISHSPEGGVFFYFKLDDAATDFLEENNFVKSEEYDYINVLWSEDWYCERHILDSADKNMFPKLPSPENTLIQTKTTDKFKWEYVYDPASRGVWGVLMYLDY